MPQDEFNKYLPVIQLVQAAADVHVTHGETHAVQILEFVESEYIWFGQAERQVWVFGVADVLAKRYLNWEVELQERQ